jgi:hypothetical protein
MLGICITDKESINMPVKPGKNESKDDFIQRCVSAEVSAGYEQTQAVAICYSIWKERQRKKDADEGITQ